MKIPYGREGTRVSAVRAALFEIYLPVSKPRVLIGSGGYIVPSAYFCKLLFLAGRYFEGAEKRTTGIGHSALYMCILLLIAFLLLMCALHLYTF